MQLKGDSRLNDPGELTSFHGGLIIAGDEMQVVEGAALVVQHGCIQRIGENPTSARVVDVSGKLLCPMFVNAHTHIGDTGAKELGIGKPLVELVCPPDGLKHRFLASLDTDTHVAMMRHGMLEMLNNGIIAFGDFREQGLEGVLTLRRAGEGLPIRAVILGRMEEMATPEAAETEGHEILSVADGIGVRDVTSYDLNMIARLRAGYPDKLFATHPSENHTAEQESVEVTGQGQTARLLDWGPDFLVHLVHTPVEDLQRVAEQGVIAVSCPRSNGIVGDGLVNLGMWKKLGLSFALGTDNMMFNAPDILREMDYTSRMVRGLNVDTTAIDTKTILKSATIVGARALKLDEELGSLAPGKEASFVAFDLQCPNLTYQQDVVSAIVHRATVADIDGVYVRGLPLELYYQ